MQLWDIGDPLEDGGRLGWLIEFCDVGILWSGVKKSRMVDALETSKAELKPWMGLEEEEEGEDE